MTDYRLTFARSARKELEAFEWTIQLDMKNGKMYRIGTDEPQKLEEFIKTRLSLFGNA